MKRSIKSVSFATMVLSLVFLYSTPIFSDPPNLTLVKNELRKYHDSGLYQQELSQVIQKAQNYIDTQAAINQREGQHKKLALILDIDETSLSNYKYMSKRDFGGTRDDFHKDIVAANAPAIKPILSLYKDAVHRGIKVFFVTGRNESERHATEKNLISAGYTKWSGLYLRPVKYSSKSIIPFKSHTREQIAANGYTIVASIGDQYSDLKGGYAKKVFKLPNPYYYLP